MTTMRNNTAGNSSGRDFSPEIAGQIDRGAEMIRDGRIVAYPTDTVYGLGADIFNDAAVKRLFAVKARPLNMPLPVLVAGIAEAEMLVAEMPDVAQMLIARFWPGGLTIIFKRRPTLCSLALAGSDKIGIRFPGHTLTRRLIELAGKPVTGTSANLHDRETALTAAEVKSQLGNNVDLVIDGGACPGGTESTIIDITINPPSIVRQGIIPLETINTFINAGRN